MTNRKSDYIKTSLILILLFCAVLALAKIGVEADDAELIMPSESSGSFGRVRE